MLAALALALLPFPGKAEDTSGKKKADLVEYLKSL